MLRITTQLAEREGALAIVTGDSLGQVASQTLSSMNVIGRATPLPLLRPLVMMDKSDIVELSQRIGTYDLSILPYEDCCTLFVPKSPTTNPNLRIIDKIEATLPGYSARLDEAVAGTETITITPTVMKSRMTLCLPSQGCRRNGSRPACFRIGINNRTGSIACPLWTYM